LVTAARSRWTPVTKECRAGRSSVVTAASHSAGDARSVGRHVGERGDVPGSCGQVWAAGQDAAARRGMTDWLTQTQERRAAQGWTLRGGCGTLAVHPHPDPAHHPAALHPRRRVVPHPVPRHDLPGQPGLPPAYLTGFDRIARQHQRTRPPPLPVHDAAPAHHLARRAQPRRPPRHPHRKHRPAGCTIPGAQRAVAQVWTDKRIQEWLATGQRPAVAVWTVAHLAEFLNTVLTDRLFAVWWLVSLRGLRRGGSRRAALVGHRLHPPADVRGEQPQPPSAIAWWKAHPSPPPDCASSPWTGAASPCCVNTYAANS